MYCLIQATSYTAYSRSPVIISDICIYETTCYLLFMYIHTSIDIQYDVFNMEMYPQGVHPPPPLPILSSCSPMSQHRHGVGCTSYWIHHIGHLLYRYRIYSYVYICIYSPLTPTPLPRPPRNICGRSFHCRP